MKWNLNARIAAAAVVCLLVLGTAAFAGNTINELFKDRAVTRAIENEYVQNVDMDYVTHNGLGIKVDSILLDDRTLAFVLNYRFEDKNLLKNLGGLGFRGGDDRSGLPGDFCVKDEQGNIFYQEGVPAISRISSDNNIMIEDNIVKQAFSFSAPGLNPEADTMPESRKIFISFSEVRLFENRACVPPFTGSIAGDWTFEIDITDKFTNRESIVYTGSENDDLKVTAVMTPTGLTVEMEFPFVLTVNAFELMFFHVELLDTDGKKYEIGDRLTGGEDDKENPTKTTVVINYPISLYDARDSYTLIVDFDRQEHDKTIVVELTAGE